MVETDGVPVHAGVAHATITPPVGATLVGYFARKGGSTSERDPLYATALVLDDGQDRVALLSCDLLWVHPSLVDEVRASVHEATGIAPDHVMICCTHTHSGPPGYAHPHARPIDRRPGWREVLFVRHRCRPANLRLE